MLKTNAHPRPGSTPGRLLSRPARLLALAAMLLAAAPAVIGAGGCERRAPEAAAGPATLYEVRGVITQLPEPGKTRSQLFIHHEAIPNFSTGGKVVGMAEMTMPFPTAQGLSLAGLKVGDPVTFTMEIREQPRLTYQVTKIVKLPEGTRPEFKDPPSAGPGSAPPPR